MAVPTFNTFSLNDSTYITETVEHRTRAVRRLESEVISRRMGKKLLSSQLAEKVIQIAGTILADSPTLLQQAVDDLHKYCSDLEGDLIIEDGRTYKATAERIHIPDRRYNQTIAPFDMQFVCMNPYSEGAGIVAGFVIPSGVQTLTITPNISGSAPNRPIFRFVLPSGVVGTSPITHLYVQYAGTANILTISGSYQVGNTLVANYDRFLVTVNGTNSDYIGQMDEIAAGDATFVITVSGRNDGIRGTLEYSPRYF